MRTAAGPAALTMITSGQGWLACRVRPSPACPARSAAGRRLTRHPKRAVPFASCAAAEGVRCGASALAAPKIEKQLARMPSYAVRMS
jgi:hypothetical protein